MHNAHGIKMLSFDFSSYLRCSHEIPAHNAATPIQRNELHSKMSNDNVSNSEL